MSDDWFEEMRARRRRRLRIAARIAGALALVGFVVWGPAWMIERASKSYTSCSNADYEDAPNPKTDCTGSKLWLLFPKIVPWKRAEALEESHRIDRMSGDRRLKLATVFAPDAAAQARAVEALARLRAADPKGFSSEAMTGMLASQGAAWRLADRSGLDTTFAQNVYLNETIQRGALDEAIAFARSAPPVLVEDYAARDMFLRRGALLCLDGAEKEGRAAFHDGMRVHAVHHSDFPFHEARIGLAACGEMLEPSFDDLDRDALWSYQLGDRLVGTALEDRLIGPYSMTRTIRDGSESPFVAAAIAERDRPLEQTLELVAVLSSLPTSGLSVWPWETPYESYPVLVVPERDEKAASRLEEMSRSAPADQKPLTLDERLALRIPAIAATRYEKLHQTPALALRNAARGFWLEAAGAWSRMGQCDRAEADVRRAQALGETSVERVYLASLLLRCGRFDAAADVAKTEGDATVLRAIVLMDVRVQALAHAGRWDEALALARQAAERASAIKQPTDDLAALLDEGSAVKLSTSYLVLALSLRAGDTSAGPRIETPTIFEREKSSWGDFIAKPEAERAALRWRMSTVDSLSHAAGRPAEIFVVGKATGGDVEVWLDKEVFSYNPFTRGIPNMRARAEAARWRGDGKVEAEWLSRAASAEKRLTTPRKLALAQLLGL